MSWLNATRRKIVPLAVLTNTAGNPLIWDIPKTGILSSIYLAITATIGGGPIAGPNALGAQMIVNRVRLIANSGIDLVNMSGVGYNSLLRPHLEDYRDPTPESDAATVIALGAYNLDMFIPVGINARDPIGLVMLQNEQTLLQLSVEFAAPAAIDAAATLTYTVQPYMEIFTVPVNQQDWPPFNMVHQLVEDIRAMPGAGDYEYVWPRGNTYLGVYHGAGLAQAGADNWTRARLRLNQSDFLYDYSPAAFDIEYGRSHGIVRLPGVLTFDEMGSSGLGVFGSTRDVIYSAAVTDITSVITAGAGGNLYTLRRQLINLGG